MIPIPIYCSNSTSVVGTSSIIYSPSSTSNFTINASTVYNIFGEDVEVKGYKDQSLAVVLALINLLGKPYYNELKKQGIHFDEQIEKVLQEKFLIIERDSKISSIIE